MAQQLASELQKDELGSLRHPAASAIAFMSYISADKNAHKLADQSLKQIILVLPSLHLTEPAVSDDWGCLAF